VIDAIQALYVTGDTVKKNAGHRMTGNLRQTRVLRIDAEESMAGSIRRPAPTTNTLSAPK
jgi:hypothetical protein